MRPKRKSTAVETVAPAEDAQQDAAPDAASYKEEAAVAEDASQGEGSADGAPTPEMLLEQPENPEELEEIKPDPNCRKVRLPLMMRLLRVLLTH